MKTKVLGFLVVALLLVPFAYADGTPVNMVFTGVNGANGTNVTNLGNALNTNNFSNTRYGGVSTSSVFANPTVAYGYLGAALV